MTYSQIACDRVPEKAMAPSFSKPLVPGRPAPPSLVADVRTEKQSHELNHRRRLSAASKLIAIPPTNSLDQAPLGNVSTDPENWLACVHHATKDYVASASRGACIE